jgi:hypothetical protein
MKLIIAPEYCDNNDNNIPSLFLGGGITSCKLWQDDLIQEIDDLNCIVYNPRRKSFDIKDPNQSEIQIRWEHKYLVDSDIVVFYFSSETLCPITLFELGSRLMSNLYIPYHQSIYIYCESGYQRKFDVAFQTKLAQDSFVNTQEIIYKLFGEQPEYADLPDKIEKMKLEGPQNYGYDVRCFDNYDLFVLTLSERIRKGKYNE